MNSLDLKMFLPIAIPKATEWGVTQEGRILGEGSPLLASEMELAKRMGVHRPESIRVLLVTVIPEPTDVLLKSLSSAVKLISPNTAGLTFGYGIFIRQDLKNDGQLLAHELVHVAQYERLGGIEQFMKKYCHELATVGYHESPLELEAINKSAAYVITTI